MTGEANSKLQDQSPRRVANGVVSALSLPPQKAVVAIILGSVLGVLTLIGRHDPFPIAGVALSVTLAWAVMIDIDRYRLPDLLTLPLIAGGLLYWAAIDVSEAPHHLLGAAAGYLALVAVAEGYRLLRGRDGLGRGDAKLLAAAGAWLGWKALPIVVLAGSFGALVFVVFLALARGRIALTQPLPFGPFLAAAIIVLWIWRPLPLA